MNLHSTANKLMIFCFFVILFSCEKNQDYKGKACFEIVNETDIYVNDEVVFSNCSENAGYYLWEFGDESISFDKNPTHKYLESGTYNITLTIQDNSFSDINADEIITSDDRLADHSSIFEITIVVKEIPISFPKTLQAKIVYTSGGVFYEGNVLQQQLPDYNSVFKDLGEFDVDSLIFNTNKILTLQTELEALRVDYSMDGNNLNLLSLTDYAEQSIDDFDFPVFKGDYNKLTASYTACYYSGYYYDDDNNIIDVNYDGLIDEYDKNRTELRIEGNKSLDYVLQELNIDNINSLEPSDSLLTYYFDWIFE